MNRSYDSTGATRRSMVTIATNTDADRAAAAETVRRRARDADDARLLLAALGLDDEDGAA